MENQTITLQDLRKNVAEAVKRTYGVERAYAKALNSIFTFRWYEFEASDNSDNGKLVKAEKSALYEELKAAEHTNPSTVWGRIRKYGKEEAQQAGMFGEEVPVEGEEGEGDGAGNSPRDPMTRNIDELIALYKFNKRQDSLPSKVHAAQTFICSALRELGVDLTMVDA